MELNSSHVKTQEIINDIKFSLVAQKLISLSFHQTCVPQLHFLLHPWEEVPKKIIFYSLLQFKLTMNGLVKGIQFEHGSFIVILQHSWKGCVGLVH